MNIPKQDEIQGSIKYLLKRKYPEFYSYLEDIYPNISSFPERLYRYYNNITEDPLCPVCGRPVRFINFRKGYGSTCGAACTAKYSVEKIKQTKLERYGTTGYNNAEQRKKTCLEKYGVESTNQLDSVKQKIKQTKLERYGDERYCDVEKIKQTKLERYGTTGYNNAEQRKKTCLEKYGVECSLQNRSIKDKADQTKLERYGDPHYTNREQCRKTFIERYGVEYGIYLDSAKRNLTNNSRPNQKFAQLLDDNGISYQREFRLGDYIYDFRVDDILIEINPTATHNSTYDIFGRDPKPKDYHINKTRAAGAYRCIHVWDWDDPCKVIYTLRGGHSVGARKCTIKDVDKKEADEFLNKYHFQNTCKGQTVRLGLYYNDELVELMTFGKPRYNKHYQWELLRLCSSQQVIGGSQKLFKYFVDNYNPESIISYCDNSKFTGEVYHKLGFELKQRPTPSRHWYDKHKHITDNLLRQRGFDQLFGTDYGKNTSNDELMLSHGFVELWDCGQSTYCWKPLKIL